MAYESSLVCLLAIQFFVLFSAMEVGAKISAVIVFGDSTVDAGNNNHRLTIVKCNYRPYGQDFEGGKPSGRWSNGRLFTDFISDALGIKQSIPAYLDPNFGIEDFATGVTFASGGAGYDNLTTTLVNAIPLWKQLEFFKEYQEKLTKFQGKEKTAETIHEALYIVSIGTNDFMLNYLHIPVRSLQFTMEEFQKFLAKNAGEFIKDLYSLGARKIALDGSVPMGCLPFSRTLNVLLGRTCVDGYNKVGTDFNLHLIKLIEDLRKEIDGIQLVYADAYIPLSKMMQTPSLYGLEEVKIGCCGTGIIEINQLCSLAKSLCKDPTKYIYWDSVHLTEKANSLLADSFLKTDLAELI
ncbi:GDSL esterase/lipase At2g04570-like [Papaver somniferum]|uniref:GDSL esterase/lipase At2g04570-like n=1 Tax=Papaver somniferum TaxID=3469 RepID=UPI000E70219C|nr:GDSL esterase/lipase At2g04570-like [Papaver somniferum]